MSISQKAEREGNGDRELVRTVLTVAGLVLLFVLLWQLLNVLLIAFAAVVIASVLIGLGDQFRRFLPISHGWAVALATLTIALLLAAFFAFLGTQLSGQIATLLETLPRQLEALGEQFNIPNLSDRIAAQLSDFIGSGSAIASIAGYTTGFIGIAANFVLMVVAAVYLAQKPEVYRNGTLVLLPADFRSSVAPAARHAGRALRLWMLGQLASMIMVGVCVAVGLWVLGVPSALALGLFAGLADFVPVVGPIASAVPALLVALPQGPGTVAWVVALFFLVQQIESNVFIPLIQRRAVDLPPALSLFSLIAFSVLFGPLGLLLSAPLTVVIFVAVKELYIRNTLHEKTAVPGERKTPKGGRPSRTARS